ncbi:aspartate aminotransferase family protein [Haloferax sp. Atlit-12N]|uniref:aspartate aminotransferase family protein n=1 Tax=Haloferax sp. Atlit-12N TaxID=2077203 RepID=UPI000E248C9C|nr:aspartate aminotransferase family protein [Haloferax sp. Atlit-12N]RDZ59769.1 aspartate aminotransferase family protein [Haloferax sp. Atlit-12N]
MGSQPAQFMPAVSRFIGEDTPCLVEGDGAILKDDEGNEYIDFFAQHAAMSHGYSHPKVVDAVTEQVEKLNFSAYDFPTKPSRQLTNRFADIAPGDLERSYFVNSGSEAVEVALTLARRATGNHEFIALGEAFHGRTYGARSLVGWTGYRDGFGPFLPSVTHIPSYNCDSFPGGAEPETGAEYAELLEYALEYETGDVAAFIAEPMFGTAGNIPAPEGYFQRIREICDEHDILFIADEVITGFGRTGKPFGIQHYDVTPDIMTTAKAIGGGMPIGATIATPEVADAFESMDYFSTFGGNPVATTAAVASIDVMEEEKLPERAAELGDRFMDRLQTLQSDYPFVGEIRGEGLMIGVELIDDDGAPLEKEHSLALRRDAIDRGLILPAGQGWEGNVIRINPPLVISDDELDRGIDIMEECFEELAVRLN